jgi:hypothetical protein
LRDDPGPPAVIGEYACAILIIKIVYSISNPIAGTVYPFCNGPPTPGSAGQSVILMHPSAIFFACFGNETEQDVL